MFGLVAGEQQAAAPRRLGETSALHEIQWFDKTVSKHLTHTVWCARAASEHLTHTVWCARAASKQHKMHLHIVVCMLGEGSKQ